MNNYIQTDRDRALSEIAGLAAAHNLTLDDIGAVLTKDAQGRKSPGLIARILGYLGAALIFGGLALYIGMQWDMLPSAARVIITYGTGFTAFVLAVLAAKNPRYHEASTVLFIKSALLLPTGMFVFLHEYSQGGDPELASIIVFGLLTLQFLATFSKLKTTSLLFFTYLFFNVATASLLSYIGVNKNVAAIALSLSILMVSWKIDSTSYRAIAPFWYFTGGVGLMISAFDILEGTPLDTGLAALSAGLMYVSVRAKSRTLLTVSTVAFLAFLGYYTDEYFKDIVGWPIALIIAGFGLVAISAWAVKLGRTIKYGA